MCLKLDFYKGTGTFHLISTEIPTETATHIQSHWPEII